MEPRLYVSFHGIPFYSERNSL